MNSELTNNEFRENEEENDSIDSFIENVRKKSNPNQPSLADYLESKKFVKLNKKEILKKINKYTNDNISDEELIEAQIKNPDNHKRRNDLIEETCEKILNEELKEQEYHNLLIQFGIYMKNKIIYETYNYPELFIPLKEAEKAEENTTLFIEGILSKLLINNKISVVIKKDYIKQNSDDAWLGYDNIEGEWYIAYHGTGNNEVIGKRINMGLIPGEYQNYDDEKNINELSNEDFPLCGRGVYLSPLVSEAEEYSGKQNGIFLNNIQYNIIFMCRVNPYKIRIADKVDYDYWVVGGDSGINKNGYKISEECRPYRILLKKTHDDDEEYNEN